MAERVAISRRLAGFDGIRCLGVRPSWDDYTASERGLISKARLIYYPTRFFYAPLAAAGRAIYPSWQSHYFGQDKIRQLTLFSLLNLPLPSTRVFYGRQRGRILDHFTFPFIAKTPRASALGRGVFFVRDQTQLDAYLTAHKTAYIQEYLEAATDVRVVIVGGRYLAAYSRLPAPGEFRANLAQGGAASFEDVPEEAVELGLAAAQACGFDEMGLDVLVKDGRVFLIEANLLFGRQALTQAGIDLKAHLHGLIVSGEIERRLGV